MLGATVGERSITYGKPQPSGYVERWVRAVSRESTACALCFGAIPRGREAHHEPAIGLWECDGCRAEGVRAESSGSDATSR